MTQLVEVPTLEVPVNTRIHLIGGEKGGVGKSMVARLLAQYFIDSELPFIAFDTDRSHGALLRFYPEHATAVEVDTFESLDRIIEAAVEVPGRRVLVDLAAQTHAPVIKWMDESGVLDMADLSGVSLHYWHLMDSGRDSVGLLRRLLDGFGQRVHYIVVKNQLRGDDFSLAERSGEIERALGLGAQVASLKRLHENVVHKIDARDASFRVARNPSAIDGPGLGMMERQRLRLWLNHVYETFARVGV